MSVKQLTEHHLEFLSLTIGCKDLSEYTLVKMLHCWKSHVAAHMILVTNCKVGVFLSSFLSLFYLTS